MSLSSVFYVCLAVSLYPAIYANRHIEELKEHFEHLSTVSAFACDAPQPRLLTVEELLSHSETHGKAFFPDVTVLHRCDRQCGSCSGATYTCGPTEITNVTLIFKITFLETIGIHEKASWLMQHYHLHNHTQCGCFKIKKHESLYPTDTSNQHSHGDTTDLNSPTHSNPQPASDSYGHTVPTEVTASEEPGSQTYPGIQGNYSPNSDTTYYNGGVDSSTTPTVSTNNQPNDKNTWVNSEEWRSSFQDT